VARAFAGQKSHNYFGHSTNSSCLHFPCYVYLLKQASNSLVDGHFAAKALVTDAIGCKMNFHHLMLVLNVYYISQHFLLPLHTVAWK
jgi:hypothetical protein